jgi:glycosyltransferase involved in cell wall biosynthesis/GT2 family glycosyltransferase
MKTLMLIPVYNCGKTLPTLFSFLYKLGPQPDMYVFAENNSEDNTLDCVRKFKKSHKIVRVWFRKDAAILSETTYDPIAHIRQLLLTFARNYDPDYAIFLDSDVYPCTRELVENLSLWSKDLVGGSYLRLFPEGIFIASKWENPNNPQRYALRQKIHMPLDEPLMTSAGCMCLSRRIIQDKRINFYPIKPPNASEDFGYCLQARNYGYNVYLDGTSKLHHPIPRKMPPKPWTYDSSHQQYTPFFYGKISPPKRKNIRPVTKAKLRIGLLSTSFFGVPPSGYSGLEQVVWDLACALDNLGHEVTLFAPEGSKPPPHGKLVETGPAVNDVGSDWVNAEKQAYRFLSDNLPGLELDILCGDNHFGFEYFAKACNPELRVTHTHHERLHPLNVAWWSQFKGQFNLNLIAVSKFMARSYAQNGFEAKCIYNGVDLEKYGLRKEKSARFLFLGRIIKAKGPHLAIEAARKAGVELDVVGSTTFVDDPEYVYQVEKLCDGDRINFVGEVSPDVKINLLQNARGLLVPSNFGEPFGLISVEALACGTVPIAFDDGALPEIIIDGQSGFIVNSVELMQKRISHVKAISPEACRERALQFSREKMAQEYVKFFETLTN